ncbi:MAG: tetratricopeptide repeat protein [Patescibacteria group bacterium]|nr:tetratricopeptide repeat protein [Patescibacteria group bacterium]
MKKRDKEIKEYLKERKKVLKERQTDGETETSKKRKKKKNRLKRKKEDYAVNELPEIKALKSFFSRIGGGGAGRKKQTKGGNRKLSVLDFLYSKNRKNKKGAGKGQVSSATNKERLVNFLDQGIHFCIYAVLFIAPLLLIPITPSPLEFPKEIIFSLLVGMATIFWLVKIIVTDKIEIKRSFLFVPITIFLLAYALSGMLSIYPDRSFWGYAGGESSSLLILVICILYFFIVTNNISSRESVKKLLFVTLLAGAIASIYATLQIWGIHIIELHKLENRSINTVGTFTASAIYFAGLAILAGGLAIFSTKKLHSWIYLVFILTYLVFLASVFYRGVWIIFILASGLMLAIGMARKRMKIKHSSVLLPGLVFVFGLVTLLLGKPLLNPGVTSNEMLLGAKDSINIAYESIKEDPFFGPGPDTFSYQYELFRPDLGQFSSMGINKPASYIILLAGTTGLLTLMAYLFLLFVLSRFTIANAFSIFLGKNKRGDTAVTAVSIFWLFLTVASFFYLNNILLIFLWWFALAVIDINRPVSSVFSTGIGKLKNKQNTSLRFGFAKFAFIISVLSVICGSFFIVSMYISGKRYLAAYHYQQALDKNSSEKDLPEISSEIEKAIKLDKKRDLYFRNASIIALSIAQERVNKAGGKLSGEDSKYISDNIGKAVIYAEKAIELNPKDFENYRNIAWIYQEMGGLDKNFSDKSLIAYKQAMNLSRNNPDLYYQLGNLYFSLYQTTLASVVGQKTEVTPKTREYLLSAEENLKKAIDVNKYHFGANLLLVATYDLLGENKAAFEKAKENWNTFFGNSQAGFSVATYYYKNDQCVKARPILETVLEDHHDYSNARYLLGICLAKLGETGEALNHFEEIKLYNQDSESLDNIINDLRNGKTDFLLNLEQKESL